MFDSLKHRITILKKERQVTDHGVVVYDYSEYKKAWASVVGYNASYNNGNVEIRNEIDYKITTRYRTDIHAQDRIIYAGKRLTIVNEPVPVQGEKRFIMFNAQELIEGED